MRRDEYIFFLQLFYCCKITDTDQAMHHLFRREFKEVRKVSLLEAVIRVERPLAPAGGGVDVQPVRWEHHEDEVGVQLLLLLFRGRIVVVYIHTCRSDSVSLEGRRGHRERGSESKKKKKQKKQVQKAPRTCREL